MGRVLAFLGRHNLRRKGNEAHNVLPRASTGALFPNVTPKAHGVEGWSIKHAALLRSIRS